MYNHKASVARSGPLNIKRNYMSVDRIHDRVASIIEAEKNLVAFRKEIEKIRDEINAGKIVDANLGGIKDLSELGEEDMETWQLYKAILRRIDNLDKDADSLFSDCDELAKRTPLAKVRELTSAGKESRAAFMAWMNNKNPSMNAQMLRDGDMTIEELKSELAEDIERCK